ncbi:mitochondrial carrier domain-containing protein [Mycena amicta]|nr:mitochondrial carrier domain-containing protein [Mycena amicta]
MTSTLPPLVQAFSGAIGSASANTLSYPLDLAVTRLQLDPPQKAKTSGGLYGAYRILHKAIRRNGVKSLYNGLVTDTGATLLSNFFYFYVYSFLRYLSTRRRLSLNPKASQISAPHKPGLGEEIILGFIAGVASRAVSTPLNIITTRLQLESDADEDEGSEKEDVTGIVNKIYREQGLRGFWRGFKTTFLLCMNPALTLAFFQVYRRLLARATGGREPNPRQAFLGAAVANSLAASILYPLMLAKTRLYASSATSLGEVLHNAYKGRGPGSTGLPGPGTTSSQPGIAGLYQGLEMQISKGFLSQGVTFLVKGRIEELIVWLYTRK